MGDLFLQQRRERASSSAPSSGLTLLSSGHSSSTAAGGANSGSGDRNSSGAKPKSFAEIQAEQLSERNPSSNVSRDSSRGGPSSRGPPSNQRNARTARQQQIQQAPREQGVIHTLLDKFGFIHCANRPTELFFHHTSIQAHWDTLNIGDEVEFTVGYGSGRRGEEDKIRAQDVRILPEGSVVWEKEVEKDKVWEGRVKSAHAGRDRGGVLAVEDVDGEILYTIDDCKSRLGKGDTVQFSLVIESRTGNKLARNIKLIQSERERQNLEREAKLLENTTVERGVVVKTKGDFGFLKSVSRLEEVYFHISHVEENLQIKEGQEVEFYVIDESSLEGGRKRGKNLAARKIKCLPPGSVKFEHVLASGVTGIVVECPIERGMEGFGRSNDGKKNKMGKICLEEALLSEMNGEKVTEVLLQPDLYPGGFYAMNRVGSEMVRLLYFAASPS